MLLITGGNASSSMSTLAQASTEPIGFQVQYSFYQQLVSESKERLPGNMNPVQSVHELLDCCIMYYFAVAHKYIIMVSYDVVISSRRIVIFRCVHNFTDPWFKTKFVRLLSVILENTFYFIRLRICGTTLAFYPTF